MKRYIPLQLSDGNLVEAPDSIEPDSWSDPEFAAMFEDAITQSFDEIQSEVNVSGATFKDCVVYKPKPGVKDFHYLCFDDVHGPTRATAVVDKGQFESEGASTSSHVPANINKEAIYELLDVSAYSDKFYNELRTVISSDYVLPSFSFEGDPPCEMYSTSDLLSYSKLLVIGSAGTGKTSLARKLAYDCGMRLAKGRTDSSPIPVYIKLRDYSGYTQRLSVFVEEAKAKFGRSFVSDKTKLGRILFIFDGLDELEAKDRSKFLGWLGNFQDFEKTSRILITSRNFDYRNERALQRYQTLTLEPFSKSKQLEYCMKSLPNRRRAFDFFRYIEENSGLQSFLSNPLSLALAVALYSVRGILPFNISNLVEEIVDHLTKHWDEKRSIHRYEILDLKSVHMFLSRLAAKLQVSGLTSFSASVAEDLVPIEVEGKSTDDVLSEIRFATGLLRKDVDNWSFSHAYFQDFFCANFIVERIGGLKEEFERFTEDELWIDVWRQLGQRCTDPEVFDRLSGSVSRSKIYSLDRGLLTLLTQTGLDRTSLTELSRSLLAQATEFDDKIESIHENDGEIQITFRQPYSQISDAFRSCIRSLTYLRETPNYGVLLSLMEEQDRGPTLRVFLEVMSSFESAEVRASDEWTAIVRKRELRGSTAK